MKKCLQLAQDVRAQHLQMNMGKLPTFLVLGIVNELTRD